MLSEVMGMDSKNSAAVSGNESKPQTSKKLNSVLWILQVLLAAVFLFAGSMKLILPIEVMTKQTPLPGLFIRFIGVAEVLGALGLILPGLLKVRVGLTPLAASGLLAIMVGATLLTLTGPSALMAWFPLLVGILARVIAYTRWRVAPLTERRLR
jgi:uncharacterized membrane protein YphA (DoxX/SURF4 family)